MSIGSTGQKDERERRRVSSQIATVGNLPYVARVTMIRIITIVLATLTFLPIAAWLPGGETDPGYLARLADWGSGTALCVGVGVLVWMWTRRRVTSAVEIHETTDASVCGDAGTAFLVWLSLGAGALYLLVARVVFSGRPLLIDELIQVLQAQWFAAGRLGIPSPMPPEFFSVSHVIDQGPLTYSQYPAGGPAMLALGAWADAAWVVNPLCGALTVYLFGDLLRAVEPQASRRWHRAVVTLFALAPFWVFMAGSHMNHVTTLLWTVAAMACIVRATRPMPGWGWGLATGWCLGMATTIRPLDGAVFAVPAGLWLLWRARDGAPALRALLASGLGIALPIAVLLWVNVRTTGAPLRFGYEVLWGANHGLGFHESPWGIAHTPLRGVELVSLYLTRLAVTLFETPFPALVPALLGLWMGRSDRPMDRYLLVSGGLLLVGYACYCHDGNYLGPRFLVPLLPVVVLWSGRGLRQVAHWLQGAARPVGRAVLAVVALLTAVRIATERLPQYHNHMQSLRFDIATEAARVGARHALVFVQESWGTQVIARLWGRGVPRNAAERLYGQVDLCRLDQTLRALEAEGMHGPAVVARLNPLRADSARTVASPFSPDDTERFLPGTAYDAECVAAIARDRAGTALYTPFRLVRDGNVYARWLPGRLEELAAQYPDRAVYLVARAGTGPTAPLTWTRVERGVR